MVPSRVLHRLRSGGFVRLTSICRVTEPWLAELVGRLGFDGVWYDLEHRTAPESSAEAIAVACRASGCDLMVRVRKSDYGMPMRMLEIGANGLMVPHMRSAAEARRWVDWCRFPPLGSRGFDGAGADADYMLADPAEHIAHANHQVFLAFQVEDRAAVEAINEIAAVEGFDILFVGPADLSLSLGVPFEWGHPELARAIRRVADAAARFGKWWGLPVASPEAAREYLRLGARVLAYGSDHVLLVDGYRRLYAELAGLELA